MSAVVFHAHDACQREHLLWAVGEALDELDKSDLVESVVRGAFEGDETSTYVWTFYRIGFLHGGLAGRDNGMRDVYREVYASKPKPARNKAKRVAMKANAKKRRRQ